MAETQTKTSALNKVESVAIVVNYNDWELTQKTVQEHIQYDVFDKIVIVDNNSSDDSYSKLQQIVSDNVKLFKAERNGGYGYGNNQGANYAIKKFHPDYLVIMNPDVKVQKESVEKCFKILEQYPSLGSVSPIMKNSKGEIHKSFAWKHFSYFQECIGISTLLRTIFYKSYDRIYYDISSFSSGPQIVDVLPGSLVIFRTNAFTEAGMYDENIFLFVEERVIAKRLKKVGYSSAICSGTYFLHHHSMTINKTMKEFKKHLIFLKSKCFFLRTYSEVSAIKILVFKILCIFSIIEFCVLIPIKSVRRGFFPKT